MENWELLLSLFMTVVICSNVFTQRKLPFKIEFKYILFHKPAFHRLINTSSQNYNRFNVGKTYCRRTIENATVLIWIIT